MKTYKEMADNLLTRINEYEQEKKRRKRAVIKTASVMACLCIAVLISVSVFQYRNTELNQPTNAEKAGENDNKENTEDSKSEIDKKPYSEMESWENSMKTINCIFSNEKTGESLLENYYPDSYEKYRSVICTALAYKMNIIDKSDYKYPVIIELYENLKLAGNNYIYNDLEQLIDIVNSDLDEKIDIQDGMKVFDMFYEKYSQEYSNKYNFSKKYYFNLTKEQILEIADVLLENKDLFRAGIYYVGSGNGEYQNQNWDTTEGIETYCELHGDGFIMNGNEVECTLPYPFIDENGNLQVTTS